MFGSSLANGSSEKGKGQLFDEQLDYLLELANHGVFRTNQSRVYRRNLIITISDEVWDNLEDPDIQKWLRKCVPPSHNIPGSSVFIRVDGLLAGFKQTGRT